MKHVCILLCLLVGAFADGYTQGRVVTGQVTDAQKEPLPGVNISVRGSAVGTTTDGKGNYRLAIPSDNAVLIFSFIGYQSQETPVGNRTVIDLTMTEDVKSLNEVVIVGYGTQKKSDLTGSVSSIGSKEIRQVAVASLDQAMQGRAAGVQVTQGSAAPGGGVSIRIRGGNSIQASNEPLYVIDGIPIFPANSTYSPGASGGVQAQNALANLNPGDIESIEVLKDASATAIYGSRGANGVVIITTKRGKAGATNVDVDSYYGVQNVARRLPLLNASEFATIGNEARANANRPPMFTPEQVESFRTNSTDWQDAIFRQAPIQNHQVTVSGGNEGTRFAVSGNYFDQQGVVINSGFRRASLRVNVDKTVSKRLNVGTSLQLSRAWNNQLVTDITRGGVVNAALVFSPTLPVRDPQTGQFTFDNSAVPGSQQVGNPVQDALETRSVILTNRILGSVYAEYAILPELKLRLSGGMDYQAGRRDFYAPSTNNRGRNAFGSAVAEKKDVVTPVGTVTLTYNKAFNPDNQLTLLGGYESQSQMVDFLAASSTNFPTDALLADNLALGGIIGTPNSGRTFWRLDSWFGRANYTFRNRYLFTATFRADGSSRFGSGNKWGYFPSAAIGWRLSEEKFIQDLNVFSNLKISASYGLTGNQEIGLYQSLSRLNTVRYPFGGAIQVGLAPGRVANPDLRWERTAQYNLSLEAGFLNNRIAFEAAWYYKRTRDLLLDLELPRTTGFTTILQNLGSVENRGVELALTTQNTVGALRWSTSGNITFNDNKVLELGPGETFRLPPGTGDGHLQIGNSSILQVGQPVGSFFGFVTDGIYQTGDRILPGNGSVGPGDIRYVDLNNDGVINNSDRTLIGNPQPKFFYGLTNNLTYRGFDLNVFFQGVHGNSIWNVNSHELERNDGATNNIRDVLNRWRPDNPSNEWPSARTRPFILSDRNIEDGSFLRLRNVTLGYTLPAGKLGVRWVRSVRLYAQGQNLLTFTRYTGFDPEVSTLVQSSVAMGIDRGAFPMSRMFIFGVNLGL